MRFTIDNDGSPLVRLSLKSMQYFEKQLPTLCANDIPLLHILPDGTIVLRTCTELNSPELRRLGFEYNIGDHALAHITSIELGQRCRS